MSGVKEGKKAEVAPHIEETDHREVKEKKERKKEKRIMRSSVRGMKEGGREEEMRGRGREGKEGEREG